jgi:dynein heavy chain
MVSDNPVDLVMFNFAIEHIVTISRILKQPGGNGLLIGLGGSGRQSLTKLASEIADIMCFQIQLTKAYSINEWREDMRKLTTQVGGLGKETTFLITDVQIKETAFLEDINNLLNAGEIPNLYDAETKPELIEHVRKLIKTNNDEVGETMNLMYGYFVDQSRSNMHVMIATSPIGDKFRNNIRQFPSLVNCCTIDWF